MSLKKQYLEWRKTRAVGCIFAHMLAQNKNQNKYGQRYKQLRLGTASQTASQTAKETAKEIAKEIAKTASNLVAEKEASTATFLFPPSTTLEHLARVMLELGKEPRWGVTTTRLCPLAGKFVALRVVRDLPLGEEWWPSDALAFGDFPEFPQTRKASVTALAIFLGEPMPGGPLGTDTRKQANLAHLRLDNMSYKAIGRLMETSKEWRTAALEDPEDTRAKAKVTLVVSPNLAHRLGCHP